MLRGKICRGQNLMAPKGRKHIKVWPEALAFSEYSTSFRKLDENIAKNFVCDFPWTAGVWVWFSITTSGHTCLSGRVGMIFKHEWRSHECLKNILTHPLRHTWPEVVMGNHTHTSAVHGKSFHNGLTKRSIIFILRSLWPVCNGL